MEEGVEACLLNLQSERQEVSMYVQYVRGVERRALVIWITLAIFPIKLEVGELVVSLLAQKILAA